jgi:sulfur carrier protein
MKVIVNGSERLLTPGTSLHDIIKEAARSPEHVVAAVNGDIFEPMDYAGVILKEGDEIDLMTFVGGG